MSIAMIQTTAKAAATAKRGPQRRSEETRNAILEMAIEMFSSLGYEGVSVRALEVAAGVQRGAVAYHFDGKESLWKAAIDRLLERFGAHFDPLEKTFRDLDDTARMRALIAALVRFSAETPQFNRLLLHEGGHDTWRMTHIVDRFIRERLSWLGDFAGLLSNAHDYYIVIGAATFVFGVEYECRRLFEVDPTSDEFIREHAARVADLLLATFKYKEK